jgi:multidrug efflux system membrane fusion protein
MRATNASCRSDASREALCGNPQAARRNRSFAPSRWLAPALALLLVACGGDEPEAPARRVLVVQPGAGNLGITAYAGEVRAREEPPLAFRIGGKLARRLVDVGDRVAVGQALAQLDASDVSLQLEGSRAALASADADLALAKAELDRYKNLFDQQLVSRSLFETRQAQFAAAAARVRQARAQASVSGNQAGYAVLRAPRAGVIAQRLADVGEVVAAGQPVYVIAAEGEREVAIAVPEQQVSRFKPGMPLAVELWAQPGRRLPAQLREIAPSADPQTRTYAARVTFDGAAAGAEVGQSARVFAQTPGANSLAVPLSAIVEHEGRHVVWVVREVAPAAEGRPARAVVRRAPVKIGPYGEESVPVLEGVTASDWVVAAGAHLLQENQPVRPVDRHDREVALAPVANRASTATAAVRP